MIAIEMTPIRKLLFKVCVLLLLFFHSCENSQSRLQKMIEDHNYWSVKVRSWNTVNDSSIISYNYYLYSFSTKDTLIEYEHDTVLNSYSLRLPKKNWEIKTDSTLQIGKIMYEYRILNDTTFVLNFYQTNTLYDTLRKVNIYKPLNIQDTIVIHSLDSILKI